MSVDCITSSVARQIDNDLLDLGYTLSQLMEISGISAATCIRHQYPASEYPNPSVLVGPGNNGGDGLVVARYLKQFGYSPQIVLPISCGKFPDLVKLCTAHEIPVAHVWNPSTPCSLIVDAILGFGSVGSPRSPYSELIGQLGSASIPIVSIDIPSGWTVDSNVQSDSVMIPDCLISLTYPKPCSLGFKGIHFLCGLFLPPVVLRKYNVPPTPSWFVRLE